jgi:hypothetical protein
MIDCKIWSGADPEIRIAAKSKSMIYQFLNTVSYAIDLHKNKSCKFKCQEIEFPLESLIIRYYVIYLNYLIWYAKDFKHYYPEVVILLRPNPGFSVKPATRPSIVSSLQSAGAIRKGV